MKIFKNLIGSIFKALPGFVRISLLRRFISIPDVAFSEEFTVKLAETKEELESAYRLLYESYRRLGIIPEHSSQMRCTPYSVLPETVTVVVHYRDEVAGTVSLIMDSRFGLPSDHAYGKQNNQLRTGTHKLCEVSALAVSKDFRAMGHAVSLLLMKYLYNYCRQVDVTHLVCTIHPRARDFYEALWNFKSDGSIRNYDYVDALSIHMYTELNDEHQDLVVSYFKRQPLKKNPGYFVVRRDKRFQYPDYSKGKIFRPLMTPELLEYFFLKKTDIFESLTLEQQAVFFEIYLHYFESREMEPFLEHRKETSETRGVYRVPVQIPCSLKVRGEAIFCVGIIRDLSDRGAFVHSFVNNEMDFDFELVQFTVDKMKFNINIEKKWVNRSQSYRLGAGLGVSFLTWDPRLKYILGQKPQSKTQKIKRGMGDGRKV